MLLLQAIAQQELILLVLILERLTKALAAASSQLPPHAYTLAEGAWCLVQHMMHEGLPKASMHAVSILLPVKTLLFLYVLTILI